MSGIQSSDYHKICVNQFSKIRNVIGYFYFLFLVLRLKNRRNLKFVQIFLLALTNNYVIFNIFLSFRLIYSQFIKCTSFFFFFSLLCADKIVVISFCQRFKFKFTWKYIDTRTVAICFIVTNKYNCLFIYLSKHV